MAEAKLPCPVRLPSGTTFSEGVDLDIFLKAAERHRGTTFDDPKCQPADIRPLDKQDFIRSITAHAEKAATESELIVKALVAQNFDAVLREAIAKLTPAFQLEICQSLLHNLGMVAVRSEYFYPGNDGEPRPWIEAMREWCRSLGFVPLPSEQVADVLAYLEEKERADDPV